MINKTLDLVTNGLHFGINFPIFYSFVINIY